MLNKIKTIVILALIWLVLMIALYAFLSNSTKIIVITATPVPVATEIQSGSVFWPVLEQ
jgi:preprotein translocase subunit SecG